MSNPRPLHRIAAEISKSWGAKINFAAKPYLNAMRYLGAITDDYGYDTGKSVVTYFLCNASSWRGDDARRIKAELKEMMKIEKPSVEASERPSEIDIFRIL